MKKTIYALGVFDGVHVGHAQLLQQCRRLSQENGTLAGAVTFGTHPDMQVFGKAPVLINNLPDRERLLKTCVPMDTVVVLPFDEKMRTMPWQDFLRMLQRDHGAAGFVCGEDFCFGNRGEGTALLLENYCRDQQLPCCVVPEQTIHGIRVSSTHIRKLLEAGDLEEALRFLGHPHLITGNVDAMGNLMLPEGLVAPGYGTYQANILMDGTTRRSVISILADRTVTLSRAFWGKTVTLELIQRIG